MANGKLFCGLCGPGVLAQDQDSARDRLVSRKAAKLAKPDNNRQISLRREHFSQQTIV
jgi:hypothetical protein